MGTVMVVCGGLLIGLACGPLSVGSFTVVLLGFVIALTGSRIDD